MNKLDITIHDFPPPLANDSDWIGLDIEVYGMDKNRLHRADTGNFACLTYCPNGKDVYILQDVKHLPFLFEYIRNANFIFQNGQFDIRNLRRWMDFLSSKKYYDTLVMEKILYSGYYNNFSLKDLSRRYLKLLLNKETRNLFEEATSMTDEMVEYACQDAALIWHIRKFQMDLANEKEKKLWYEIDQPTIYAILDMPGFKIDVKRWMEFGEKNESYAIEEKAKFPFNPSSPPQVKKYFAEKEGINLKNTEADTLEGLTNSDMAQRIVKYRKIAKLSSTYGKNWISKYIESDERVYTEYKLGGTVTGRLSSSEPNINNIPVRDNPEFRECFIAGEGNILVIGDYSTQEPRCLALETGDKELIKMFRLDQDVYCEVGRSVYGELIEKSDPRRKLMKTLVLGLSYGLSVEGFARDANVPLEEAERIVSKFYERFSGFVRWSNRQQSAIDYVTNVRGRKIYFNKYNNQWNRIVLNAPIQSDASEITKLAMIYLHRKWPRKACKFGLVASIYDELVIEIPEQFEEKGITLLRDCMLRAADEITNPIPGKVEIYTGKTWASKH